MSILGANITFTTYKHRQLQSSADLALGATAVLTAGCPKDAGVEPRAIAVNAGFANDAVAATATVDNPPATGPNAGNDLGAEVILSQAMALAVVGALLSGPFTIIGRALEGNSNSYCALAFNPSVAGAISIPNDAIVSSLNCDAAANSTTSGAVILRNNAQINGPISVCGNRTLSTGAKLSGSLPIHATPTTDPYAGVQLQTIPSCTGQQGSEKSNATANLTSGHFRSAWDFVDKTTMIVAAGTYYIDLQLDLVNNGVINGTGGVTLITNGNYFIDFGNNDSMNITAPATASYADLPFFGLRTATSDGNADLQ